MTLDDPAFDWAAPRAELHSISPAEARHVLARRNPRGRPIDAARAEQFANLLRAGRWDVNGETITFYRDGTLRNGQHRLTACVLAGRPIATYVVFGTE